MSTNLLMLLTMLFSSMVCLILNSWVTIWVMLELNTLSFCCLLKNSSKETNQKTNESIMKYLIIQSVASAILIMAASYEKAPSWFFQVLLFLTVISLMTKAAAAPIHQWFVSISKHLKWEANWLLFTWQKLAPIYLLLFQFKAMNIFFIFMSSIVSIFSMLNKKNLKEIMALSSVFNLSWMILSINLSSKSFFLFTLLYWITVSFLMKSFLTSQSETIEEASSKVNKWTLTLYMMSLAGLPPLIGFLAKWLVFSEGLKMYLSPVITLLLIFSSVNLYIYLRISNGNLMKNSCSTQTKKQKESKATLYLFLLLNSSIMVFFLP